MMKPYSCFLSLLPFVVGSMAKGRSGGGGGSISINDSWNVPGEIKAAMAFQIIWFVLILGQFITVIRRLRFVPPGRYTRAPYILLAVVAGPLALAYLLLAIYTRISTDSTNVELTALRGLNGFFSFLFDIDVAFRPGVCLWLVHLRGNLARASQGKTSKPWVSQFWKRIVDWSLVAMVFLFALSYLGVVANAWALSDADQMTLTDSRNYSSVLRGLDFTSLTFYLLLLIDIFVSLIALKVSQKSMNFVDPVAHRLLVAILPFVFIDFINSLVSAIYPEVNQFSSTIGLYLSNTILNGLIRVGVIGALLSTMTIPNALWAPAAAPAGGSSTGYVPQPPQQPQQSFYQPPWQGSPSMPTPGQYPHPGQYQPPQNPPLAHQTYVIPNNP